jgi:hypothetical protein
MVATFPNNSGTLEFNPPIQMPLAQGISVNPVTTLGDCYLTVTGWLGV